MMNGDEDDHATRWTASLHVVDRVLVRNVGGAGREDHLDEAANLGNLGDRLVEVGRRRAAVREARLESEGARHRGRSFASAWQASARPGRPAVDWVGSLRSRIWLIQRSSSFRLGSMI